MMKRQSVQQNVQQSVQHENEAGDLSGCFCDEKSIIKFEWERVTRSNSQATRQS
jgi:hypothetical protein